MYSTYKSRQALKQDLYDRCSFFSSLITVFFFSFFRSFRAGSKRRNGSDQIRSAIGARMARRSKEGRGSSVVRKVVIVHVHLHSIGVAVAVGVGVVYRGNQ